MGPFYKLCPERTVDKYKKAIQKAIRNAEAVMLIEQQLLNNEIARIPNNRTQANAHAQICMNSLRKSETYFDTDVVRNVRDAVDVVFINMGMISCLLIFF